MSSVWFSFNVAQLQEDASCKGDFTKSRYIRERKAYYEGEWKNKRPHGKGKVLFSTGEYF